MQVRDERPAECPNVVGDLLRREARRQEAKVWQGQGRVGAGPWPRRGAYLILAGVPRGEPDYGFPRRVDRRHRR